MARHTLHFTAEAKNNQTGDGKFYHKRAYDYEGLNDAQFNMMVSGLNMNAAVAGQLNHFHGKADNSNLTLTLDGTADGKHMSPDGKPIVITGASYKSLLEFQRHTWKLEGMLIDLADQAQAAQAKP
jgi:hypothetical protein